MAKIVQWFKDLWQGFVDWLIDIAIIILTFIKDLFLVIFELFLDGVIFVFTAIPVPDFLTNGLSVVFSALPESVTYFLSVSGFSEGLAIYGAGVTFNMLRKLFTLGQW